MLIRCVPHYHEMERFFPKDKLVYTGNPIRENIVNFKDKKDEEKVF